MSKLSHSNPDLDTDVYEEFYEWRLCTTCEKETIHDEHNVKYGYIPFVCRECKTRTIITGYEEEML